MARTLLVSTVQATTVLPSPGSCAHTLTFDTVAMVIAGRFQALHLVKADGSRDRSLTAIGGVSLAKNTHQFFRWRRDRGDE